MSYTPPGPSSTLSSAATVGVPVPQAIRQGLLQTAPLAASVFTYGLVFGALSRQAGLSTLQALLMSALVYAGSAQFLALGMLTTGATALPVIISTLIVNLRHLLMGASLAAYLKGERPWRLALAGLASEGAEWPAGFLRLPGEASFVDAGNGRGSGDPDLDPDRAQGYGDRMDRRWDAFWRDSRHRPQSGLAAGGRGIAEACRSP